MRPLVRLLPCLFVFAACAACPLLAHDSEPINTEFAAPFTYKAGNLQFGLRYAHNLSSYDVAAFEFEYGVWRRMQFSISAPLTRTDASGKSYVRPGNVELAYRYLLAGGNERRFALSINPEVTLPVGDKRVAERAFAVGGALHLDLHPSSRLWTHLNLGYETPVARFAEKEKVFFYRAAAMYHASERFQPVLELVGEHDFHDGKTRLAVVPEVIFSPVEHWEVKAGVPLGATRGTPDVGFQFQLTWKFGREGRQ
ncbi:MAG: hypothetical protein M3O85_01870 [Acidobacteriota bacterium]|nr:hypothetical protein [Acidobacteriota bacterium]